MMEIGTFFLITSQGVDITKEIPAGYLVLFALVMAVVLRIARKVLEKMFLPRTMSGDDIPIFAAKKKKNKGSGSRTDNE